MLELSALNAIDFTVVRSFPSEGCEFYVTLRRGRVDHGDTDVLQARRLKLQRRTLEELREQAEMLDARDLNEQDRAALSSGVGATLETPRFMSRTDKVLCSIDRSMGILELGPLYNSDRTEIRRLAHHGRRPYSRGSSLSRSTATISFDRHVADRGRRHRLVAEAPSKRPFPQSCTAAFDAFIASHVFDTFPTRSGSCARPGGAGRLLSPTGVVSLVIPDKRFCFDFFQASLYCWWTFSMPLKRKADRHTRKALFDQVAYRILADGESAFSRRRLRDIDFDHSLEQAKALFDAHSVEADAPVPRRPRLGVHALEFCARDARALGSERDRLHRGSLLPERRM